MYKVVITIEEIKEKEWTEPFSVSLQSDLELLTLQRYANEMFAKILNPAAKEPMRSPDNFHDVSSLKPE